MVTVIVHCSASKFGNAAEVTRWHLERGWRTIGYHYVILNGWLSSKKYHYLYDGHLETGRPLDDDKDMERDEWGAHAYGYNNTVGICMIGESGKFTPAQMIRLFHTILELKRQFGDIRVIQHSDVDPVNKPWCAGLSQSIIDYYNAEL